MRSLLILLAAVLLVSCGVGDDDNSRLADSIAGTWYRDSMDIVGDVPGDPEDLGYHRFVFQNDGNYNGMVRQGSFAIYTFMGSLMHEGTYKCDNDNLRLEFMRDGELARIHAQVLMFNDTLVALKYDSSDPRMTVRLWMRKGNGSEDEEGEW